MSVEDAVIIFNEYIADPTQSAMSERWNDDIKDYPKSLLSMLINTLKLHTLKWIDEHQPKAWYRNMFVREGN